MASQKQRAAARRNVKKAQAGAKKRQTLKSMPKETKTALGKEANKVRKGQAKTRKELNAEAARLDISGRSKMGKDELRKPSRRAKKWGGHPRDGLRRRESPASRIPTRRGGDSRAGSSPSSHRSTSGRLSRARPSKNTDTATTAPPAAMAKQIQTAPRMPAAAVPGNVSA